MEKTDAEILAESREYLETHGWWRGAMVGPNGRQVCGMGAVVYSQGWSNESRNVRPSRLSDVYRILGKVLVAAGIEHENYPDHLTLGGTFVTWNDDEVEGKQEVLDAFMKAEKIERSGNVEE